MPIARTEPSLEQMHYVVRPLVLRAGQILTARQKDVRGLSMKQRHERGQAIEEEVRTFMHTTLLQLFSSHTVFMAGEKPPTTTPPWQWVVNPLDGGRYYFRGLPFYAVSLALRHNGEVVLGLVVEPSTNIIFHALKGVGAFMNEQPLSVSDEKALAHTVVYLDAMSSPASAPTIRRYTSLHAALLKAGCRVSNLNARSLGLCYLAAGAFDAFLSFRQDTVLSDLLAGFIVAKEAGASVTDGDGKALRAASASDIIMVSAPGISKGLVALAKESA